MSNPVFPIINLPNSIEIQKPLTVDQIEILRTIDDPMSKTVKSLVKISTNPYIHNWYTIWSDSAYDEAGQWTDEELVSVIIDLVTKEYSTTLNK